MRHVTSPLYHIPIDIIVDLPKFEPEMKKKLIQSFVVVQSRSVSRQFKYLLLYHQFITVIDIFITYSPLFKCEII